MAANYKSDVFTLGPPVKYAPQGVIARQCVVTIGTTIATGDTWQLITIPAGCILINYYITSTASLGTTVPVSVGDGTTAAKFASAFAFGGGASMVGLTACVSTPAGTLPYLVPVAGGNITITATLGTVGTPAASGSVQCWVEYTMDP